MALNLFVIKEHGNVVDGLEVLGYLVLGCLVIGMMELGMLGKSGRIFGGQHPTSPNAAITIKNFIFYHLVIRFLQTHLTN